MDSPSNPATPRASISPGAPPRRPLGRSLLGRRSRSDAVRPSGETPVAGAAAAARAGLVTLSWADQDIENRWGIFKGGRYTSVNKLSSFIIAAIVAAAFLGVMALLYHSAGGFLKIVGEAFIRETNLPAT